MAILRKLFLDLFTEKNWRPSPKNNEKKKDTEKGLMKPSPMELKNALQNKRPCPRLTI